MEPTKTRKKRSIVWKLPKDELTTLVNRSTTFSEVIRVIGLAPIGGNVATLKRRLREEGIDFSHIPEGLNSNSLRRVHRRSIPLEEIMVQNSSYSRGHLKRRLLQQKILAEECAVCGLEPRWEGKKLVLVLDHINGVRNDHRLENLRLLCPNCNSQTETFCGKQNRKIHLCNECGNRKLSKASEKCTKCASIDHRKVKERPTAAQLALEIQDLGYKGCGRKYGVSDNAIRKWLKESENLGSNPTR